MKKFSLLLCILLLLSLLGCGKSTPDLPDREEPPVAEQTAPEKETTDTTPLAEEAPVPTDTTPPPTEEESPVSIIDTKYYTLTLPSDWIGKCICDRHERDDGRYSISVHESGAFFKFGGGTLFTIMMLPTSDDTYKDFPSYELLGSIDTPDGTFYLVALFPTDVQFDPESEESVANYTAMFETVTDVLYTITPKDGIEMAMP